MRRKDREVTQRDEIRKIIAGCKVCHLGMMDEGIPYVIPLNFGYEMDGDTLTLYFHSAFEGKKTELLKAHGTAGFSMCLAGETVYEREAPCRSGCYFSSVIGNGSISFVTDTEEKCRALSLLMKHAADADVVFEKKQADTVCVLKLVTENYTGKRKARPQARV